MEQGDLDVTPDLFDSPHIRLDIATEFEMRKDPEYKKRKREEDNRTGDFEDIMRVKTVQVRSSFYEDNSCKRFRSSNKSEERVKKKSHESERLERLERERKRLESERFRQLDRIQKERDHEREVAMKEKSLYGRVEEEKQRDDRKGQKKSIKDSFVNEQKRPKHEHKERRSVKVTSVLSSPCQIRVKEEKRKDHKKREKKSSAAEQKDKFILDKIPKNKKEEKKEYTDEVVKKKTVIGSPRNEEENSMHQTVRELSDFTTDKSEQSEQYGLYYFARSKFDDDEEEEEEEVLDDGNINKKGSSPREKGVSPILEGVEEDSEKIDLQEEHSVIDAENLRTPTSPGKPTEEEPILPAYYPAVQGCRNVEEFHCLNRINEGTYGVVYRAVDLKLREVVALKRLKMEKEKDGFPITSLREIKLLMKARHPNIVRIKEVVVGSNMDKIYLVMEYVEHDMKSLMESMKEPFTIGEVKTLLLQLLRGVQHLHDNWIIHRDLKTSNLLLSHSGILKIGDFGLAREYGSPLKPYTPIVVTLWYRSPELLLGAKMYSTTVDMWSVGCIFGEFLLRKPLFPGGTQIEQLNCIFKDLGSPNEKIWPGLKDLPGMKKANFSQYQFNQLRRRFGGQISEKGFQLMNSLLTYCPEKRVTADNALTHDYFNETPLPTHPSMFPTWPAKSELCRTKKSPKAPSGGKALPKQHGDEEKHLMKMNFPMQGNLFRFPAL